MATTKEIEQSTQETQIASQGYLQLQEEDANFNSCWGLLYPIAHKGNKVVSPWRFNKDKKQYNVGRSASCDVKITGQIISNVHCHIIWDGLTGSRAGIHLIDQSRNGTWVKGQRVAKGLATTLHEGDEVAFGVPTASQNGESHRYTFRIPAAAVELKGIHVNYIMEQELGKGSFATVVKALHRASGQYFAVKVIPRPKSLLQPNTVKMLEREMAILRQLDHPNIVKLVDVVPSDVELCLVMELVTGGDLFDYILSAGYLPEDRAGPLTAELCDAMAYIHFKGITHRDLKPENILLTSTNPPVLKVADFGLAKCVDSQTMLRTMCGTPSYLAPEVVLQDSRHSGYDQKVDSWSVGAIVFAMLTGHSAFKDEEDQPLPKRMKERTVAWEHMTDYECSQEACDFVNHLLQFEPTSRMSQADALRHPWLYPTYCQTGVPSFFIQHAAPGVTDQASPGSFAGSVMSAPAGTPMNGISEEFQHLELESDSMSESPAFIDFEDATVGGSSDLAGSQQLRTRLKEREQSWDLVEESADPEQTPLARPRNLPLEEEQKDTVRMRPAVITDLSVVPPPTGTAKKRKMSSSEDVANTPGSSSEGARGARLGARKASKVSEYDTPTTATRAKAPNGGGIAGRKASVRGAPKGKPPVVQDFAEMEEE